LTSWTTFFLINLIFFFSSSFLSSSSSFLSSSFPSCRCQWDEGLCLPQEKGGATLTNSVAHQGKKWKNKREDKKKDKHKNNKALSSSFFLYFRLVKKQRTMREPFLREYTPLETGIAKLSEEVLQKKECKKRKEKTSQ
jgi:hypothetical protein